MTGNPPEVRQLPEGAHAPGSDPRDTNHAGGNTSAKGVAADPVAAAFLR
jgi:rhamnose utilization protein RhaD (predicted bifunctional aldolase and dehydrogenase)